MVFVMIYRLSSMLLTVFLSIIKRDEGEREYPDIQLLSLMLYPSSYGMKHDQIGWIKDLFISLQHINNTFRQFLSKKITDPRHEQEFWELRLNHWFRSLRTKAAFLWKIFEISPREIFVDSQISWM